MRVPRRSVLGLVLAAVLALLVVPARAAGEGYQLYGATTSFVDVTVHETSTISTEEIVIRTSGRYAGFYLLPAFSTADPVGALWAPHVGADPADGGRLIRLGRSWDVSAGQYRLFLIAERSAEVFVPLKGSAFRALRPVRRAAGTVRLDRRVVDAAQTSVEWRGPLATSSRRTLVTHVALARSDGPASVDQFVTCVSAPGQTCPASTLSVRASVLTAQATSSGIHGSGRYDAVTQVSRTTGIPADISVSTLTLVLPT
jgi:hypothetical protein